LHSYLTYLRDRAVVARQLLADSGTLVFQIGDENVHRVRILLDEVFGAENFVAEIAVQKTGGLGKSGLTGVLDFLLWYAKDAKQVKYRQLFRRKRVGIGHGSGGRYDMLEFPDGIRRSLTTLERKNPSRIPLDGAPFRYTTLKSDAFRENTTVDFYFEGAKYHPGRNNHWKTRVEGLNRLTKAERIASTGASINYVRRIDDFPAYEITNLWTDVGGAPVKLYVVQTSTSIIERVLLMTTDPGDLVFDPTSGSGTTAYAAEKWGRRWVVCDTSRVAVAVSRQRLLTSTYDFYKLNDNDQGIDGGLVYKSVPHITLGEIANNEYLDPIFERHQSVLDQALTQCNLAIKGVTGALRSALEAKLQQKQKAAGKRTITNADERRWRLPKSSFQHWTVPFDTDPDWPEPLKSAVIAYRTAWRSKMDEVNACIAEHSEQEVLVDDPEVVSGIIRVSGPFTVEGVRPEELALGSDGRLFDPTPNEFDDEDSGPDLTASNASAYLDQMVSLIRKDGVTFLGNERKQFARVTSLFNQGTTTPLHAEAAWKGDDLDEPDRVAIAFGPQYGPVTAHQVENLMYAASRGYEHMVVCGFSFTADASALIQADSHPRLKIHAAFIRPDVNEGMKGLLKDTGENQLFTVFGQPDVEVRRAEEGDCFQVELKGVDIYDPVRNVLVSSGARKVAAWFLDQDYDGRCFCVTQAFFPNQDAWKKIAKALKSSAPKDAFKAFKGTCSVPFEAGRRRSIAVKVIDPRGNEVMSVHTLPR